MWSVKDGRLYCGTEPVAVRRVVVEIVAGRAAGPLPPEKARTMLRMERAISIRTLSETLSRTEDPT
jgi:hypothetical protein